MSESTETATEDAPINHRKLLRRYIDYVGECEGVDFLSYDRFGFFTPEEWAELRRISGYE